MDDTKLYLVILLTLVSSLVVLFAYIGNNAAIGIVYFLALLFLGIFYWALVVDQKK